MAERYVPPEQSGAGQFFDSIFLLVLVYASLLIPVMMGLTATAIGSKVESTESVTWENLGQNATMQGQWEKLGFDAESAAEIINSRFDYTIDPVTLAITALAIIGYFFFVVRVSDREYREVIKEKFGSG